jgi:hypothetical protein
MTISAVHPELYYKRFLNFMKTAIQGVASSLSPDEQKMVHAVLAIPCGSFVEPSPISEVAVSVVP